MTQMKPSFLFILLLVVFAAALQGCNGALLNAVDRVVASRFPTLTHEVARQEAVRRSSAELARMGRVGLLLNVPMASISEAFHLALVEVDAQEPDIQIISASVAGDEQGLRFIADVKGKLKKPGADFRATLDGWAVVDLASHTASVQPGFRSARITALDLTGFSCASKPVADAVNVLLASYIDHVNGKIKRLEYEIKPGDLGLTPQPIRVQTTGGRTVELPALRLGAAAVLVEETGVYLAAELSTAAPPALNSGAPSRSYVEYRAAFWAAAAPVGATGLPKQAGLYLSQELITRVLSPGFEPVKLEALQQRALYDVLDAVGAVGEVAAGAVISADTLCSRIKQALLAARPKEKDIKFGEPEVRLGEQMLLVDVPVQGVIRDAHLGFRARLTAAGLLAPKKGALYVRLAVAGLTVDEVFHTGGQLNFALFVASVNRLVEQFVPYVNAAIDNYAIALPLPTLKPVPLTTDKLKITPRELVVPIPAAVSLIPRIDPAGLHILVVELPGVEVRTSRPARDMDLEDAQQFAALIREDSLLPESPGDQPAPQVTPVEVNQAFERRWLQALPAAGEAPHGLEAVVAMRWVTSMVNRILEENRIAVSADFDSGSRSFESGKLRLAEWLTPSCSVNRQCARRGCDREPGQCKRGSSCDWNCQRCVKLFGKKICSDDPACKASRVACNFKEEAKVAACNVEQERRVAACNVKEEAELAACRVVRNLEIAGCNIANETIRAIRHLDGIGRFSGEAQVHANAAISDPELSYEPSTGALSLAVNAQAVANLSGRLKFMPYDVGHVLVCPVPGSVPFKLKGVLAGGRTVVKANVHPAPEAMPGRVKLELTFDPVPVSGQLSPAPVDALLTQNPQVFVLCNPVLTGTLAFASAVGKVSAFTPIDVIKALERAVPGDQEAAGRMIKTFTSGQIAETVALPSLQVEVPEVKFRNGDEEMVLQPRWREGHVFYGL